jgi:peroxiredoxin
MISSVISLQKARPWYMNNDEGSNLAVDNAVTLKDLFSNKTVAMFGVPAPFTGVCTEEHYPGYSRLADEFLAEGCDEIVCYTVSDPYALDGWQKALKNDPSKIRFLADPKSSFAKAYGVDTNYDDSSLGDRSIRFSMLVVNGNVQAFRKVEDAKSDAATLLSELKEVKEHAA